jgi:hypothetical protein
MPSVSPRDLGTKEAWGHLSAFMGRFTVARSCGPRAEVRNYAAASSLCSSRLRKRDSGQRTMGVLVARPHDSEFALRAKLPQRRPDQPWTRTSAYPVSQRACPKPSRSDGESGRLCGTCSAMANGSEETKRTGPSFTSSFAPFAISPVGRAELSPSCQVSNCPVMPQASRARQLSNVGVIVRSQSTGPSASPSFVRKSWPREP